MTTDPAFRLSTYVALALGCAALGAAEFPILPEVGAFAAVVIVALVLVYHLETRIEFLSLAAANNLGIGIALAAAAWAGVRIARELRVGEFASVGWGVFIVLLLAPVLMAAVVAKLLRREKDAADYWYLHAAALGSVVLAAAIARQPWEIALLVVYTGAAVWSLARFALARGGAAPADGRRAGLAASARWFAIAAAIAVPVFALTPASPFERWEFGPGRIEVGFAPEQTVDLNRTGHVVSAGEIAFEVVAVEGGRAKDDLPSDTRWRGRLLAHYTNGGWRREATLRFPYVAQSAIRTDPWSPPDLGPGAYRLHFSVPPGHRTAFLAEPVVWVAKRSVPIADTFAPPLPPRSWFALGDGSFLSSPTRPDRNPNLEYVQHTASLPDPDLGVGFLLSQRGDPVFTNNPVPAVKTYSTRLLARLVQEGKLPPAAASLDAVRLRPPEDQHEAVARAFARYLSESPEFTYTLDLKRTRPDLDPVEEFLVHGKTGHCERYASALVLMLRSQGIPAALVLGFKGHEAQGDGRYLVRQDRAHAWATALVSRPGDGGSTMYHWLSLDPSPASVDAQTGATDGATMSWKWVWDKLLDATPEERLAALVELSRGPAVRAVGAAVVALALLSWGVRRAARLRGAARARNALLDPLFEVLARRGFTPAVGETPREFATRVAEVLAASRGTSAVADVPLAWVDGYYQERYGGRALAPDTRTALYTKLAALRAALVANPTGEHR
jgi:transglutaminase-like putative cysteine protease